MTNTSSTKLDLRNFKNARISDMQPGVTLYRFVSGSTESYLSPAGTIKEVVELHRTRERAFYKVLFTDERAEPLYLDGQTLTYVLKQSPTTANTKPYGNKNSIRYEWKRNRQTFLNAAAKMILEAEIVQSHFYSECEAIFKIALETELAATVYGNPTDYQRRQARNRIYQPFKRDLERMVYKKMPSDWTPDDY